MTTFRTVALTGILLLATTRGWAEPIGDLYTAHGITTGTGETNRRLGFEQCLRQAILKISGDQRLLDKPAAARLFTDPGAVVSSFSYRDRLSGVPLHDEQGSNDRPHDLTCIFEPKTFDVALATLGGSPWRGERPKVAMSLAVSRTAPVSVLTSDNAQMSGMIESLANASQAIGLSTILPSSGLIASTMREPDKLAFATEDEMKALAGAAGGDVAFSGSLVWRDAGGWNVEWRFFQAGKPHRWRAEFISFDDAFRIGLRGAAQILSGNGSPD